MNSKWLKVCVSSDMNNGDGYLGNAKVVFVVGAGASVPFQLPTGFQLLCRLCDKQKAREYGIKIAPMFTRPPGDTQDDCVDFADNLCRSGCQTIDAYLESNTALEKLGKLLIAAALLDDEMRAILDPAPGWDWLGWIFRACPKSAWKTPDWPVSFVTFNYDRIIEFAFRDMLRMQLALPASQAGAVVRSAPIKHLYGRFEDYEESNGESALDMPTKQLWRDVLPAHYASAASGIRIISDHRNSNEDSKVLEAQELLKQASTVVFLGFGFDSTNLTRLGVDKNGNWPLLQKNAKYMRRLTGLKMKSGVAPIILSTVSSRETTIFLI